MGERPISIRLDEEAEKALRLLTRSGRTQSEAVRDALIEAAERRRPRALADEAERLAADPEDRAEMAKVAALMKSLRAAG